MGDLDLVFSGVLDLGGRLELAASDGKVKVDGNEMLVQLPPKSVKQHGTGVPVMLPPPPAGPADTGTSVWIISSFNASVTIGGAPVVALGMMVQSAAPVPWPGMVMPSTKNAGVAINGVQINVVNDSGVTLPNGGSVTFDASGQ